MCLNPIRFYTTRNSNRIVYSVKLGLCNLIVLRPDLIEQIKLDSLKTKKIGYKANLF